MKSIVLAVVKQYPGLGSLLGGRALWMAGSLREAVKTYAFYLMKITGLVKDLYRGKIDEGGFVDAMADLIPQQLRKAWNEGLREEGVDPEDADDQLEEQFQEIVLNEYNYVERFAADIRAGAAAGTPIAPFLSRAGSWANRYNDTVNRAKLAAAKRGKKLKWIYNPEKEHCKTCVALNNIVAYASEWDEFGLHPQGAPNEKLECGGWKCGCRLEPTNKRRSRNVRGKLAAIAGGG